MKDPKRILQLLGMAARARMVVTGEELALREVRSGQAHLVIISDDASANTLKKITDKCTSYNVEKHVFGSREDLGHAIGKESRVVLAITDAGFAKKMSGLLNEYYRGWANDENTCT
jgi:ribosomal protein L7Ae-like RNA K-turn-binding protein